MQATTLPFYQHAGVVLDKCRDPSTPLLLSAPTGSGKTLGIRKLVEENPSLFGKTLMVQPTRIASRLMHNHAASNIVSMTPLQAIDGCLRSRHPLSVFRTLIIDEVHTRTVEYYTLLSILHRKNMSARHRIVLMSATADPDYLSMFFHDFRTYDIPVESPFPIDILYYPHHDYGFINAKGMVPVVKKILKVQPNHRRVLVFAYTHEQCDKLASDLQEDAAAYNQGKTFALYGGMMPEDMEAWHKFLADNESFIVVATNVAETSITIPNLSLIIDFGIHCVQENNRIVYRDCSKSSLQQRAGRTGRTCAGKVVRVMSEDDYEDRPVQDDPELQWDLIVLRMLRFGANPAHLLPHHVRIEEIVRKFVFYGLMETDSIGRLNHRKVQFVLSCPMSMKNSCLLHSFLSSPCAHSYDKFLMFIIAVAVVDCCEARMIRIYYYKNDRKMSKSRFLDFIRDTFAGQLDELEIHINVLFSCLFASNPVEFSNAFSLNFRSIRQLSASIHKVMTFASNHMGRTAPEWKTAVRASALYSTHKRKDLSRKNVHDVCLCTTTAMDHIHRSFFMHTSAPCMMTYNDLTYRDNFVTEFYNCLINPYTATSSCNHLIIPLGFDDTKIASWGDRTKPIPHSTIVPFSMYTLAPVSINDHVLDIRYSIRSGHRFFSRLMEQKKHQKERFQPALEDIREDVAYRPGQWKMMECLEQLMTPMLLTDIGPPHDLMDDDEDE